MSIQNFRERRATAAKAAKKLLDDNPKSWPAEAASEFDRLTAEIEDCDKAIAAHQRMLDDDASQRSGDATRTHSERTQRDLPDNDPRRIFDTWLRRGDNGLSAEQWAIVRNTMSTTTGSEGGYTVPSLISDQLVDAMKAFGTMRRLAETMRTANGQPLSFPTSDGTSEVGEVIAQNTTATAADPTFGTVSLNVFKYSSKIVAAPIELLQDSTIDMEAFIRRRLAQRLGRIMNQHFTTGAGTTVPDGVVPRSTLGKVGTTGQTLTVIYDDLVDVVHSLDPAYRGPGAAWQTNDTLLKVLRKLKDTAGRPIWTPSYDGGIRIGPNNGGTGAKGNGGFSDPATPEIFDYLLGYPLWVNNDMPAPAANAKSLTFGDHSYYKIRDAMEVTLFRFTDSAYAKLGQVGFLAWARAGGNLIDQAAVKYYQHSAT
jgi:HK97 family phage major capsid protein